MIKILRSTILAVLLITFSGLSVVADTERIPTIELKDFELKGTAISGIFEPIAIIEDRTSQKTYWYKVGDAFSNGRIAEIRRGSLLLDMNGQVYLFGLPEGEIAWAPEEADGEIAIGERIGQNRWRVELGEVVSLLTRAGELMKEARIRPYFAIGRAAGVRIDRIEGSSVIGKMGIEDGDIIKGVNGFGIMTPTRIFEAYRRYKDNRVIELQLIRRDEPITLTYNITK